MRMVDLISKKKSSEILTDEEIQFMIDGYVKEEIPDYQMSAMLMAICFNGMTDHEMAVMTGAMAHSGDMVDLSAIEGIKVDKHSTGGVGDKTTLVIAPIVAACGGKVAKMSGRGLGHTGGTVDKMESIPGMRTSIPRDEFFDIVNKTGLSVIGQSGNLAPADKKLYALRDVTATVNSIPLIASSIMSKKLAAGSDSILLDVKTGSGAFMKTLDDSILLASKMVAIGEHEGRRMVALITDMDTPLGNAIGSSLEVIEAIQTLQGNGPEDLTSICLSLSANMLHLSGMGDVETCKNMAREAIASGRALGKLIDMVEAQGGDSSVVKDTNAFEKAPLSYEVRSDRDGYVTHMNTERCGIASVALGAGRVTKESAIDYSAGIILDKKVGAFVNKGDLLATLYASDEKMFAEAESILLEAYTISDEKPKMEPLIFARVSKEGIEKYS
ncbi:pyrimidine-nucleoside phosphorylase [Anaerosporobacter sp.]|uniref:pyrimidine-nucleoside phosphorylase n=1 Tax=Anaerosporobacter sp. TaxID=1872529 RepID=UPI00286F80AB|nr:pyrimidine-nucleoside phosphorylase [Anaerosporobacter sp.]